MKETESQLLADITAVVAAVAPIDGLFVGEWGNPKSVRIDFQKGATEAQVVAAEAAVQKFDWSEAALLERRAVQKRRQALRALLQSDDPIAVAIRAVIRDVYTQINDTREAVGAPRELEHIILPRLTETILRGGGDAMK